MLVCISLCAKFETLSQEDNEDDITIIDFCGSEDDATSVQCIALSYPGQI